MVAVTEIWKLSSICESNSPEIARITWTKNCSSYGCPRSLSWKLISPSSPSYGLGSSNMPILASSYEPKKERICVLSPDMASPSLTPEVLDAWEDEYNGVIIDPEGLPSSANAFASALRASLSNWKIKGKKGVWLKVLQEQAELVPIAIQEGFNYHHAEPGYVMLTNWLPNDQCMLPGSPSHQIGIAGFVINDQKQILVVKEKCPCSYSGVWKLPTGYINKAEEIFSGAVREVKEETGVDTTFLEMVAFRHAHRLAFDKSDLQFVCMLKPLSLDIIIDEKEIQDAKWITFEELLGQAFYNEDEMSKRVIEICMEKYQNRYQGFVACQLISKLDAKLTYLYCKDTINM